MVYNMMKRKRIQKASPSVDIARSKNENAHNMSCFNFLSFLLLWGLYNYIYFDFTYLHWMINNLQLVSFYTNIIYRVSLARWLSIDSLEVVSSLLLLLFLVQTSHKTEADKFCLWLQARNFDEKLFSKFISQRP